MGNTHGQDFLQGVYIKKITLEINKWEENNYKMFRDAFQKMKNLKILKLKMMITKATNDNMLILCEIPQYILSLDKLSLDISSIIITDQMIEILRISLSQLLNLRSLTIKNTDSRIIQGMYLINNISDIAFQGLFESLKYMKNLEKVDLFRDYAKLRSYSALFQAS